MEAIKSIYLPHFQTVKDALPRLGEIHKYHASFCQYSSRYDAYKRGEEPNTFKRELSNGGLMDIGVYCLYPMVALFGVPKTCIAMGTLLESGVDAEGTLLCKYEAMSAVVSYSKVSASSFGGEIQGEEGTLQIDRISRFEKISLLWRNGEEEVLSVGQEGNGMSYEIKAFIGMIYDTSRKLMNEKLKLSKEVMKLMDEARQQMGIVYPADRDHTN